MSDKNQVSDEARKAVNDKVSNTPSGFVTIIQETGRSSQKRRLDAQRAREKAEAEKNKGDASKVKKACAIPIIS